MAFLAVPASCSVASFDFLRSSYIQQTLIGSKGASDRKNSFAAVAVGSCEACSEAVLVAAFDHCLAAYSPSFVDSELYLSIYSIVAQKSMFIQLIQRNLFDGIEEEVFVSFFHTHIHCQLPNIHTLTHVVSHPNWLLLFIPAD